MLVAGAVGIAQFFEVSNRVIAVSMIAVGTSIPELAASVVAALKHEKALLIGNIIGSNIFNIASVIGITALVQAYHNIRIKFTVTFKRCCVDAWFFSCYISSRKTTKEVLID